jgi:hypothetical protein
VGTPPAVLVAGFLGGPGFLLAGLVEDWDEPPLFFVEGLVELFVFGLVDEEDLLGVVDVFGLVLFLVVVVRDGVVLDVVVVCVEVVVTGVVVVCVGHDSVTFFTGPGRFSEDTGAPGASWKVRTWPVSSVTVTVQLAADALGSAPIVNTASAAHADTRATLSFRLLMTVALSPPAVPSSATVHTPSKRRTVRPSY